MQAIRRIDFFLGKQKEMFYRGNDMPDINIWWNIEGYWSYRGQMIFH